MVWRQCDWQFLFFLQRLSSQKVFVLRCTSRQVIWPPLRPYLKFKSDSREPHHRKRKNWGLWLITVKMKLCFLSYSNILFKLLFLQSSLTERGFVFNKFFQIGWIKHKNPVFHKSVVWRTDYNPKHFQKFSHLSSARCVFYAIDNLHFVSIWTDYSLSFCPTGLRAGPGASEALNWLPLLNQHEEWIIIATSHHYHSDSLWFICRLIPTAQLCFLAGLMQLLFQIWWWRRRICALSLQFAFLGGGLCNSILT